jgi:hypothetical protein
LPWPSLLQEALASKILQWNGIGWKNNDAMRKGVATVDHNKQQRMDEMNEWIVMSDRSATNTISIKGLTPLARPPKEQ